MIFDNHTTVASSAAADEQDEDATRDAVALPAHPTAIPQQAPHSYLLKRSADMLIAGTALLMLSPLFALLMVMVATDGGPVFYRHKRIGRGGIAFGCLKFRTMIPNAEQYLESYLASNEEAAEEWARDQKLSFDPRVTRVGRVLRAASMDELPQLVNVICGEMSLVGPRPVTEVELSTHYGDTAPLYKSVYPGITGLWQVSGRNDVSYEARVAMDEAYVRRRSLLLDLMILLKTPVAVLSRKGAR
jgi:lipopolysaccharide/colanic/teichoic acid biosynthesis glycosyltransferase